MEKYKVPIEHIHFFRKRQGRDNALNQPNNKSFNFIKDYIKHDMFGKCKCVYHIFDLENASHKDTTTINILHYMNTCENRKIRIGRTTIPMHTFAQLPSIETWFLLHFGVVSAPSDTSKNCEKKLAKHIEGYKKTQSNPQIFDSIIKNTENAITTYKSKHNTFRNIEHTLFRQNNITVPTTQIISLVQDIIRLKTKFPENL